MHGVHSFIYPGPGQRDTPVADLRTTLLKKFGTNRRKFRLEASSGGSVLQQISSGGRFPPLLFRPRWESEVGIPTSVGERSRNSDLGGRAKSEFRPRWESEVGIPISVGERVPNSDLGGRAKSECRPCSHWQKSALQSSPHGRTYIFFLGRIPTSGGAGSAGWRLRCQAEASTPGRDVAHPKCQAATV